MGSGTAELVVGSCNQPGGRLVRHGASGRVVCIRFPVHAGIDSILVWAPASPAAAEIERLGHTPVRTGEPLRMTKNEPTKRRCVDVPASMHLCRRTACSATSRQMVSDLRHLIDRPNSQCLRTGERNEVRKRERACRLTGSNSAACSERQTLEVNYFTDSAKNPENIENVNVR